MQLWAGWPRERKSGRTARRTVVLLTLTAMLLYVQAPQVWYAAFPASVAARETATVPGAIDPFADVVPKALAPAERAANELSAVRMDIAIDPAIGAISGEMSVTWRNPASQPLGDVWFRLYPNAFYYEEGGLQVADVTVDGTPVVPELGLDDTALRVPLPTPVDPGESAELAFTFTSTVPADSTGSYGIFSRDTRNGSWVLADWYPILAVWEEGDGWALPEVPSIGDPTYAPSAFFDVQVTAPDDLKVVATGVLTTETKANGAVTRQFIAGPARDFVMVADDDNTPLSQEVDGTVLTLWTPPSLDPAIGQQTLDIAADALRYYNTRLGMYPARQIDLVQVDMDETLGIAWAGLILLDGPALLSTYGEHDPEGLVTTVGHEMAHLWWGVLVGGDSNKHGFIQEGLATASSLLFVKEALGVEIAEEELNAGVVRSSRKLLGASDAVVDAPLTELHDEGTAAAVMYGKGPLGFLAIRHEIGGEAFETALRDVVARYAWGEMTPDDLRAAFETASGRDLDDLWGHWFDEAAMTREEIETIATAFGS